MPIDFFSPAFISCTSYDDGDDDAGENVYDAIRKRRSVDHINNAEANTTRPAASGYFYISL